MVNTPRFILKPTIPEGVEHRTCDFVLESFVFAPWYRQPKESHNAALRDGILKISEVSQNHVLSMPLRILLVVPSVVPSLVYLVPNTFFMHWFLML
jgi:hypothetical protein